MERPSIYTPDPRDAEILRSVVETVHMLAARLVEARYELAASEARHIEELAAARGELIRIDRARAAGA